jgi:flagellar motor switch protein FliN/FliY
MDQPQDESFGGEPRAPEGAIPDAMAEMIANAAPSPGASAGMGEEATPPAYDELNGGVWADPGALSMLYDLTMPVAIELGRTRMSVQEILAIGRGSVIQLDRLAGEPIDVFVGDRRFAEGEVVVVGEQFGVRITRILKANPIADEPAEAVA